MKACLIVAGLVVPHRYRDLDGTCGRPVGEPCLCNSCWVRRGGFNCRRTAADMVSDGTLLASGGYLPELAAYDAAETFVRRIRADTVGSESVRTAM